MNLADAALAAEWRSQRVWLAGMAARGAADAVCSQLEEGDEGAAIIEAQRHAKACVMLADALIVELKK